LAFKDSRLFEEQMKYQIRPETGWCLSVRALGINLYCWRSTKVHPYTIRKDKFEVTVCVGTILIGGPGEAE
jgi:hypothetical protein